MGILSDVKKFLFDKYNLKSNNNEQSDNEQNNKQPKIVITDKTFPCDAISLLMFTNPENDVYGVHFYGEYISPYQSLSTEKCDKIIPVIRLGDDRYFNIVSLDEIKINNGDLTPESRELLITLGYNIGGQELKRIANATLIDNHELNLHPKYNNYKLEIDLDINTKNWLQTYTKYNCANIKNGVFTPNQLKNIMAYIESQCEEDFLKTRTSLFKQKMKLFNSYSKDGLTQ